MCSIDPCVYLLDTLLYMYMYVQYFFFLFRQFIEEKIGTKYVEKKTIPFKISYEESGPSTSVFFVLSPGVDPLKDVEALGKELGFSLDNGNLHNVSLGQVNTMNSTLYTYMCIIYMYCNTCTFIATL